MPHLGRRILLAIVTCLIVVVGVRLLNRERGHDAETRALAADLSATADELDHQTAALPDRPRQGDLDRVRELTHRSRELVGQAEDLAPKLTGKNSDELRAALDRHHRALERLGEKLAAMKTPPPQVK